MVRAENLTKDYRMGDSVVHALRGVNLSVDRGEFLSIVGPSGSGKTTLLNVVGALDRPSGGKLFLDGVDLTEVPERRLYEVRRKKIGFIFQQFHLIPTLTALENVLMPVIPIKGNARFRDQAEELFSLVGLEGMMDRKPSRLSGGEQQRVAICRALINDPEVLLCDEITGELDSVTGRRVVRLLREINRRRGVTVLLVTHDEKIASESNRIVTLTDGAVYSDRTLSPHPS